MPEQFTSTAVLIGIIVVGLIIVLTAIFSTWKKVPADKAAIVTGLGKAKVITGGGVMVLPVLQRIDYITLENISFDVNMQGTLTADAVPIEANGTVVVKIKNDEAMIRSAVEQFNCGKESETKQHIMETARDVCEGRLREIIADMTAEQLYKDRKTFSERVKEVAEEQLCELGLELKSFTIKGIGDQNGYFEALSKPQIAAVKRDAEIAQAEAVKESMIKTSEARRAGEQARLEAEARMAEAKKEADIKKLNFEKERQTTQAISDAAYSIQQNVTQKDITNTEMDANVLKEQRAREVREASIQIEIAAEQKNIELAKKKAERKEAELLETVIKPSEAEKLRAELQAEAQKVAMIKRAEAEAEAKSWTLPQKPRPKSWMRRHRPNVLSRKVWHRLKLRKNRAPHRQSLSAVKVWQRLKHWKRKPKLWPRWMMLVSCKWLLKSCLKSPAPLQSPCPKLATSPSLMALAAEKTAAGLLMWPAI